MVAPLLATSFLASAADGSLMKRTPEKNDPKASNISYAEVDNVAYCTRCTMRLS